MSIADRLALLALSVLAAAPAAAQIAPTHDELVYATLGGKDLHLDLYLPPAGPAPYPLVVWIHGGGWAGGGKETLPPGPQGLLALGFAVASIDYRLTSQAGQYGSEPVIFPAQIHDVKGAVRWLRAHAAAYDLDIARFAAWGSSAGGHLTALAALTAAEPELEGTVGGNLGWSSSLLAFVDYFGPTDLMYMDEDVTTPPGSMFSHDAPASPESKLVGWSGPGQGIGDIKDHLGDPTPPYPALVELVSDASPLAWVSAGDPPAFVAHGTVDTTVPMAQSTKLANALAAAGVPVAYLQVAGAGHGFLGAGTDAAARSFLLAELTPQTSVYLPAIATTQPKVPTGSTWTFQVASAAPGAAWFLFHGAPIAAPLALAPLGDVLLDPAQPVILFLHGALAPLQSAASVVVAVPNDPGLDGTKHWFQAVVAAGGSAQLTNLLSVAID